MKLAGKIVLHLLLILAVTIIPPVVYDLVPKQNPTPLVYLGGITYPLYLGWWITRIRHLRIRVILLHLLLFSTVMATLVLTLEGRGAAAVAPFLPAATLLPSLALALVRAAQQRGYDARTHLYALLLLIPFALFLTGLIVFALSMTAMQGMRW